MIFMMGCGCEDGWEESGELGRSLPGLWSQSPPSQAPPCFSKCLYSSNVYKFPRSGFRSQSPLSPRQAPPTCFQNVFMFTNVQSLFSVFDDLILYNKLNSLFSHRPLFQNNYHQHISWWTNTPSSPGPGLQFISISEHPFLNSKNRFRTQHIIKNFL